MGSYGPQAVKWLEREWGEHPLPWQAYCLCRALEHDADGRLVHRRIGVSVPRQVGKSVMLRMLAMWRMNAAELFGEPQTVLHVAHRLSTTEEVYLPAMAMAKARGYHIRESNGQMMIERDGNRWVPRSTATGYGFTLTTVLVDEAWAVAERRVNSGYSPTMSARVGGQIWLFSTANEDSSTLFPKFRETALERPGWLLLEWSSAGDSADPREWQACSPVEIDDTRRDLMADELAADARTFSFERLNRWPAAAGMSWGARVASLLQPASLVHFGSHAVTGGLESEPDGSLWGVAVSDGTSVETAAVGRLSDALVWLAARQPVDVLTHQAVLKRVTDMAVPLSPITAFESRAATAVLRDSAAGLSWTGTLGEQLPYAVVSTGEGGEQIDGRRSVGPVSSVKAASWAVWGARRHRDFWVM